MNLIDDNLVVEFVEQLSLTFEVNPNFRVLIDLALNAGEFIRDSVIVNIADNDGKTVELFCIIILFLLIADHVTYSQSRTWKVVM